MADLIPGVDYEESSCPACGDPKCTFPPECQEVVSTEVKACEICGERFRPNDERAEMYASADAYERSVICHAQCGLSAGMEVA